VLEQIDESLEAFFRATVPLSATDIDVSFEPPDREWSAKLTRPTVNFFLWDIRRSATRAKTGARVVERDGAMFNETPPPVLELRYVVTAWTSNHSDERALLAGLIRALLAAGAIGREFLSPDYADLDAPVLTMAKAGEDHMDVFKALEGQVKPGINMVVSTEFDLGIARPAAPAVEGIDTRFGRMGSDSLEDQRRVAGEVLDPAAVGAVVRSPTGVSVVDTSGRFLVKAAPGDEIVVETDPPLVATVPAAGGVRL
jgi:Pvc16 N-terminal domain